MARRDDDDRISADPPRRRPERDDDDWQDDDDRPRTDARLQVPVPHSGIGVASFSIALVAGIGAFVSLAIAAWIGIKNGPLPKNDPAAVAIGLAIIGSGVLSLVGLVLGLVGAFQSNRRIVFAVLGTVFNLLIIFGFCGVMGLGLAMGGH